MVWRVLSVVTSCVSVSLEWYVWLSVSARYACMAWGVRCLEELVGSGPPSPPVRGSFALQALGVRGLGGCRSQGCHGFAPRLAHFTCGTTSLSGTNPQAHPLTMSLNVAKCNLGKVKIEASAGQRCPHGRDMRGGHPISQGPLGSYSSHVCANSFRICSLAGACAV